MPRPKLPVVLVLVCGCAVSGCATFAKKPPTPADDMIPRQAAAIAASPGQRYFLLVFGSQSTPKQAKYTHSWVTVELEGVSSGGFMAPQLSDANGRSL